MKLTVAVPKYGDEIAPCFESAGKFLVVEARGGIILSRALYECIGCEGFERVRLLRKLEVDSLICDGIKSFYHDLLRSQGITVYRNITQPIEEALLLCLKGKLRADEDSEECALEKSRIPLKDLLCWTKDLFRSHGYHIGKAASSAPFPIDLIAEIRCPVCHKPVRVAICCGSHTYRFEQELTLFHRVASADFHAQVYIYPANPRAVQICEEYGIELIEPGTEAGLPSKKQKRIPLLRLPVSGHEKASGKKKDIATSPRKRLR